MGNEVKFHPKMVSSAIARSEFQIGIESSRRKITISLSSKIMTNFKNDFKIEINNDNTNIIKENEKNRSPRAKDGKKGTIFPSSNISQNNSEEDSQNSEETTVSSVKNSSNINSKEKNINSSDEEEEIQKIETNSVGNNFEFSTITKNSNSNLITNNIKRVFINSNNFEKFKNESFSSEYNTIDSETNFLRNGDDIRRSYISQLISMNVWNPSFKPKQHNSIIIFDWDDTLLPTSYLSQECAFDDDKQLSEKVLGKLKNLEYYVYNILYKAISKGDVYIITNACGGWVEYTANKFYPSIKKLLSKIKIISARGHFEKLYPENTLLWKIQAFLIVLKNVNVKLITNIICLGDSSYEMEAGKILASKFYKSFIKTIKFKEVPKLDQLYKQIKLVTKQFDKIYSCIQSLAIRVEKSNGEG